VHNHEVWWDASVVDDDIARQILEEFQLSDTVAEGAAAVLGRFADQGQHVMINDNGALRPATSGELGLS
jgi:hypothetical protein